MIFWALILLFLHRYAGFITSSKPATSNRVLCQPEEKFVSVGSPSAPRSFGPPCVIVGGCNEGDLVRLDSALDAVDDRGESNIPVVVLSEGDADTSLSAILDVRMERDHSLPSMPLRLNRLFLLFSGMDISTVKSVTRMTVDLGGRRPALALAVPNAMEKRIDELTAEVLADYDANKNER